MLSRIDDLAGNPMQLATTKIIAEKDGGIGWMIFNAPERRNALSYEMRLAMLDIFAEFERDDAIRVIIMRGAGDKAFASGIDLSPSEREQLAIAQTADQPAMGERVQLCIEALEKPLIAMIKDFCLGGGLGLALQADLRIASEDSEFGIPAGRLGVAYPFRNVRKLVDAVGGAKAKEILFTARRFSAAEALKMGLVNSVEPDANFEAAVRQAAAQIIDCAPLSVRASKKIVDQVIKDAEQRDMALCEALVEGCRTSEDFAEGRRAFKEKRRPVFVGR
jgi:enoyl-CoA hydratase/carnithine racemase